MRLVLQVRGEDQDGDLKVRKLGNLDVMRLKYVEKIIFMKQRFLRENNDFL